jgi:hypothetical protein
MQFLFRVLFGVGIGFGLWGSTFSIPTPIPIPPPKSLAFLALFSAQFAIGKPMPRLIPSGCLGTWREPDRHVQKTFLPFSNLLTGTRRGENRIAFICRRCSLQQ